MKRIRRLAGGALVAVAGCLVAMALVSPLAAAAVPFSISEFGTSASVDGQLSRQAGGHPDFRVRIAFPIEPAATELEFDRAVGNPKDIRVDVPPGLIGDPTAVPTCPPGLLLTTEACPSETQIGVVHVKLTSFSFPLTRAVYNLERPVDTPALFGFMAATVPAFIKSVVRPDDFGISTLSINTSQLQALQFVDLTLWGIPGDSSHDSERLEGLEPGHNPGTRRPFLRMPTSCPGTPAQFGAEVNAWEHPDIYFAKTVTTDLEGEPFVFGGCEKLAFKPAAAIDPDTHRTESPSGLGVEITVPQNESPDGLATPDVRKTVVTFPRGVAISPSAASGQGSCSPDQIKLGTNDPPTCPDSSKVGTVEIESPLLDETLKGDVILAKQNDNPFNSLLALYLAVKGPGFYLKLPGKVDLDPVTGQVTSTFDNTPQLPFEHLRLQLNSGSRAPLVTPSACGTYNTHVEMTSWASSVPVQMNSPMTISEGCNTGGFNPVLKAGSQSPAAGAFSPFLLRITRNDGEQNLAQINATLPPGVLAKLAGVGVCPEALTASGNCPASSQVGTTTVGAGPGETPVFVPEPGKAPTAVYLAGPYKGAPYSLVVKVPAQAGPFDLGTVTVRNALYIDPETTQVTAKSDPLPQILQGIPITYRDVRVEVNRPGFTLNPTSCEPMKVTSTLLGSGGASASPATNFQAANCERLGFGPKLALGLSGAPTHRGGHPKLKAVLTAGKGEANIGKAVVTLPKTELLENAHIGTICTRPLYAANACPAKSVYGYAKAWSPLLDQPLQGPVYLRANGGERALPDLVAKLDGQIHVDLVGYIDSVNARIRTTFAAVPDAPVSKFELTMKGGKKGLLANNTNICATTPRADVEFTGQNGKVSKTRSTVKVACTK
ncbi:MAG TPA: hypothetical protein VLL27_09000 [Solirubrobacterales bacterium]|nr:hypothetical protein [Solirubrobacterales bacterium]